MGLGSLRLIQEESPAGRVRGGGGEAQGRKGGTMGCTKVGPIASHGFPSQAQTRPSPACSHLGYCNHLRPEPPKTSRQGVLSARALVSSMHAISHTNDNTDIRMGRGVITASSTTGSSQKIPSSSNQALYVTTCWGHGVEAAGPWARGFKQAPANMPVFELLVKISNWCDTSHYLFTPITKLGRPQISFRLAMGQCPHPVVGQNQDGAGALRSQGHPGCLPLRIARTGGRKRLEGRDEKEKRCCFQKEYICACALILQ